MRANVGDSWHVAKDGSFAFKKGPYGTIQIAGTQDRPSRASRGRRNTLMRKRALKLFSLLS